MIVLDSNVLSYAVGSQHRFREPCRQLLEAIAAGKISATTTPGVLQEFMYVRSRRRSRANAAHLTRLYLDTLRPLIHVDEATVELATTLFEQHRGIQALDSELAAATITSQAEALVSGDRAFRRIEGLNHWQPDSLELGRILLESS